MKKTKLNVRLLRRIQKQILKEPKQFDMRYFFMNRHITGLDIPNCGTTACIAGWAIALSAGKNPRDAEKQFGAGYTSSIIRGEKLLGLAPEKSAELFFEDEWPATFRNRFAAAVTKKGQANIAAHYIDHFIKTHATL